MNLAFMLAVAYGADQRRIENEPAWMDGQTYDFEAKVEGDQELTYEQMKPLIQDLLEHRFHLIVHWVTKPSSGYALVEAKNGPKLVTSKGPTNSAGYLMPDGMNFRDISMSSFAAMLSHPVGSAIEDRTGISGSYDIKIKFAPAGDANSSLPDIFTAVQEQLGLKLEPAKVPVNFLVIDHVDRILTEN